MKFKSDKKYMIINAHSHKAIDNGNRVQNGEHPYMWPADGNLPQHKWHIHPAEGDSFTIVSAGGLALDGGNGPRVFLWVETRSAANHRWRLVPAGPDAFLIVNTKTGHALAEAGDEVHTVHQDHHHHNPHAVWNIVKAHDAGGHKPQFKSSHLYNIVNASNQHAIDNGNRGQDQRPFLWQVTPNAANHQWRLHHVEGPYYTIVSHQGVALDGGNDNTFLYAETRSAANHLWRFQQVGHDRFLIINKKTEHALEAHGQELRTGHLHGNLAEAAHHNQLWQLRKYKH